MQTVTENSSFDNATIGDGGFVGPDVTVGFRYHSDCGVARIGIH